METLTTINTLSLFDTNKAARKYFVEDVIQRVENGEVDVIKVHSFLKKMEDIVKALTGNENYKKYLVAEVEKNGKKFEAFNAEFSVKEAGVKYDYSQCNDPEITHLQKESDDLAEVIKMRQGFLKTIPSSGMDILTQDGEVLKVYPPSKSSSTTVNVILK